MDALQAAAVLVYLGVVSSANDFDPQYNLTWSTTDKFTLTGMINVDKFLTERQMVFGLKANGNCELKLGKIKVEFSVSQVTIRYMSTMLN